MKRRQKFTATICKIGINPAIDPPQYVLEGIFDAAGRSNRPIPVRGRLNGKEFIQTLVKYRGDWRLYVNGQMLEISGLKVGDIAEIEIEFDPRPRIVPMPMALSAAFAKDDVAKIAFGKLPPSRQKEIFRYIGSLKTEESIARNVEKILRELKTEVVRPLARAHKGKSG